jgi:hypothetical protein
VRSPTLDEQRLAGTDHTFVLADAEAELALQHEPRLIVAVVHVQAGDRTARMRPGVGPIGDDERVTHDHGAAA